MHIQALETKIEQMAQEHAKVAQAQMEQTNKVEMDACLKKQIVEGEARNQKLQKDLESSQQKVLELELELQQKFFSEVEGMVMAAGLKATEKEMALETKIQALETKLVQMAQDNAKVTETHMEAMLFEERSPCDLTPDNMQHREIVAREEIHQMVRDDVYQVASEEVREVMHKAVCGMVPKGGHATISASGQKIQASEITSLKHASTLLAPTASTTSLVTQMALELEVERYRGDIMMKEREIYGRYMVNDALP